MTRQTRSFAFYLWPVLASLAFFLSAIHAADESTPVPAPAPGAAAEPAAQAPESGPLPGHSSHGEAFNEGPRQKAYLMEGMGKVSFPVTSSKPEVQSFINQGITQLHDF